MNGLPLRLFLGRLQPLPALEAGMQLMPVRHLGFTVAPAEIDLAAVHQAWEIDQAGEIVLQLHAEPLELLLISLQPLLVALELRLGLLQLLAVRVGNDAPLARCASDTTSFHVIPAKAGIHVDVPIKNAGLSRRFRFGIRPSTSLARSLS